MWEIRLDLHVLDHCGNIIDCASIAAITALKHFRYRITTIDLRNVIMYMYNVQYLYYQQFMCAFLLRRPDVTVIGEEATVVSD